MAERSRLHQVRQLAAIEGMLEAVEHDRLIAAAAAEREAGQEAAAARQRCDAAVAAWHASLSAEWLSPELNALLAARIDREECAHDRRVGAQDDALRTRELAEQADATARARHRAADRVAAIEARRARRRLEDRRLVDLQASRGLQR